VTCEANLCTYPAGTGNTCVKAGMKDLQVQFISELRFKIPAQYVGYLAEQGTGTTPGTCLITFSPTDQNHVTLGAAFTGAYYTIFDMEN